MIHHTFDFLTLQQKLVTEFYHSHPEIKDFDHFFDFPKKGKLSIANEVWSFWKHGRGVRFTRISPTPNIIVDAHDNFINPKIFDAWRLLLYVESIGVNSNEKEITKILDDMVDNHLLKKNPYNKYEVIKNQ